ncbi:hypothetical protein TRVL_10064 [Trypanosoma vivax]|nr:hypothetical protein TRVL_10064 [Trypanosoma vivax]
MSRLFKGERKTGNKLHGIVSAQVLCGVQSFKYHSSANSSRDTHVFVRALLSISCTTHTYKKKKKHVRVSTENSSKKQRQNPKNLIRRKLHGDTTVIDGTRRDSAV